MTRLLYFAGAGLVALAASQAPIVAPGEVDAITRIAQGGATVILAGIAFLVYRIVGPGVAKLVEAKAAAVQKKAEADIEIAKSEALARVKAWETVGASIQAVASEIREFRTIFQTHEVQDERRQGDLMAHITDQNTRTRSAMRAVFREIMPTSTLPELKEDDDDRPRRPPAGIRPPRLTPAEGVPAANPKHRPRGSGEGV